METTPSRELFHSVFALLGAVVFALSPGVVVTQQLVTANVDVLQSSTVCLAFMNITTNVAETGFYQILCVADDSSSIRIQSATSINKIELIDNTKYVYNGTFSFSQFTLTTSLNIASQDGYNRFGILASTQSATNCYGVKSDRGTTDGFLALPLTTTSTSFFIASWPWTIKDFFAGFQVISPFPDTCVTIWSIDSDGVYTKVLTRYMFEDYGVWLFQGNLATGPDTPLSDATGLFVNSSKPIGVISGHSCAFIPNDQIMFCDYIAEQIAPVSELGTVHVVPPIIGRSSTAGYVIRIVAAYPKTTVTWKSSDTLTSGSEVISPGDFTQLFISNNYLATLIICSQPCLVMQYNTGRRAAQLNGGLDVPSDPFMMSTAPIERFDSLACFVTASMDFDINWTVDFDNYLVVVTTGPTSTIFVDGQSYVSGWNQVFGQYWVLSIAVKHGSHCISVSPDSGTLFGAYCYGHSLMNTSSSAYGYTVAFKVGGTLVQDIWRQAETVIQQQAAASLNTTCNQLPVYSGSLIVNYPSQQYPQTITYPISLSAQVTSAPMTQFCVNQYKVAMTNNLINMAQLINFLICNGTMCPYLTGPSGSGVPLNSSSINQLYNQVMYVAIDVNAITNNGVTIQYNPTTFAINGVSVQILYTGILQTTSETYTRCRNEIRDYLFPFSKWPYGNSLFPVLPSPCMPITTQSPYQFSLNDVCPSGLGINQ